MAVSQAYEGQIQMIDSSVVSVHHHAANGEKKRPKSLHGPYPRRAYDQVPRARRYVRPPDRAEAHRSRLLKYSSSDRDSTRHWC